jgi:hypothetical protein
VACLEEREVARLDVVEATFCLAPFIVENSGWPQCT